jgi:hypothetical protein
MIARTFSLSQTDIEAPLPLSLSPVRDTAGAGAA